MTAAPATAAGAAAVTTGKLAMTVLPAAIVSQQDLQTAIMEIRRYAAWFAHTSVRQQAGVDTAADERPAVSPAVNDLLGSMSTGLAAGRTAGRGDIDKLADELEAVLVEAPVMTITLAAMPGRQLQRDLATWCRANISPQALVSFRFDRTLLGGMVVRYGSRVFDWSFRRKVIDNRDAFPALLRGNGRQADAPAAAETNG